MATFATLQEAWGVTAFQPDTALSPAMVRRVPAEEHRGAGEDVNMRLPAGENPRAVVKTYLAQIYARSGARGVARVLGRSIVADVCKLQGCSLTDWFMDEENILVVLVVAFVLLLLADLLR